MKKGRFEVGDVVRRGDPLRGWKIGRVEAVTCSGCSVWWVGSDIVEFIPNERSSVIELDPNTSFGTNRD